MEIVKKSFFRFLDKVIVLLLGAFGMFAACNNPDDTPVEYGMPYADFELKGTVTSSVTSEPIQNIRVVYPHFSESEYENLPLEYKFSGDTTYTDQNGKYTLAFGGSTWAQHRLKFEDIDGEENGGQFLRKEIQVGFTSADRVKAGQGWYEGKFAKTQDVELQQEIHYPVPEYGPPSTTFQP